MITPPNKNQYESPVIETIDLEIANVLCMSAGTEDLVDGGNIFGPNVNNYFND